MTKWHSIIADWADWMRAGNAPDTTISLRRYQIGRVAEDFDDPWSVTTQDLARWLAGHDWSAETRRSYRSALRMFYRWAYALGKIDHDPAALLPSIRPVEHHARPAPGEIVRTAIELADDRVKLMLLLADLQGLRRGEIAKVHTDDLRADLTGWSLLVHGKGDKERLIPCLDEIAELIRGRPNGFLFPGQVDGHLSAPYVGKLMSRALKEGCTAHMLRHRFGTRVYANTRDLLATQQLLGHSKPETTQNYVLLPDDALRAAIQSIAS